MRWMALLTFYHKDHFDFRNHTLRTVALMDKDTFRVLNICICQPLRFLPQGGNCPVYWVSQALWNTCSQKPCSVFLRCCGLMKYRCLFPPSELSLNGQSPTTEAMGNFRLLKWKISPSMTCVLNWVFLTYIVTRETVNMLLSLLT